MSTSGIYSYWPKVNNPNANLIQMTSGEFQPPFFFGGSQVPVNLNLDTQKISGSGIHNYSSHIHRSEDLPVSNKTGRGITTTASKSGKIFLPKHMPMVHK
jgi:hypothetical protein